MLIYDGVRILLQDSGAAGQPICICCTSRAPRQAVDQIGEGPQQRGTSQRGASLGLVHCPEGVRPLQAVSCCTSEWSSSTASKCAGLLHNMLDQVLLSAHIGMGSSERGSIDGCHNWLAR